MIPLAKTVFVSSALPPHPCGVGDFAALLASHWPDSTAVTSLHLVSRGAEQVRAAGGFPAVCEFSNKPQTLLDHLEACQAETVVLHYTARSYNKYGMPFWLGQAMTRWRRGGPRRRLLVYFHEIWNDSVPVYSKHYALQLANRRICRGLLSASDAAFTNTEKHLGQLNNLKTGTPVTWQPVSSNISPLGASESKPGEWLLFGLALSRHRALSIFAPVLAELDRIGLIRKLHIVGARDSLLEIEEKKLLRSCLRHTQVIRHGQLSPQEVSQLISAAEFCLDGQAPESMSKSGVFMAYASHGAQVVSRFADPSAPPPRCYLIHPNELMRSHHSEYNLADRAKSLREWYETNASWDVTAPRVAAALSPMSRRLVVITTNLPPASCGVGDYTARLLNELALQRPVTFILPESPEQNDPIGPANRDIIVVPRSASALSRVLHDLGPCDLFLLYSGYGYHSWGYPRWLVKAVRDWRCDRSGELTVLFCETWGQPLLRNPKTQIERLHRRLVASLAKAADHVYTTTSDYADAIRPFVQSGKITLIPVGSNIPCPVDPGDSNSLERSGVLALFGSPGTRTRVLRSFGAQLETLAERGRFHRLLVIGEDDNRPIPAALHGLVINRLGHLDPEGVSAALLRAEFGLTDEGLPGYTKSGVFAAYAAHGLGILTSHPNLAREEPIASLTRPAELLKSSPPSPDELRRRSRCLRNWYLQHADWPVAARILKPILSGEGPASILDSTM